MAEIRIAQIIGKWFGGGVESVVMNYYRNIDRSKIQFDFFCDDDSTNIPYEEIERLGGKVILIPPYQKVVDYQRVLKKKLIEGNYQIIHSHINTLSVFPLYAAKKAGVPVRIAHSHSTTNKKEWKKNLLKQLLRPWSKVFANRFFCCSEDAGRWLFGNKTYDKGDVFLLRNSIELEKFEFNKQLRQVKREELGIADDVFVVGHIGRFMPQKNHSFLIEIFNKVHQQDKNTLLVLVGQGPLMDEVKNQIEELKLSDSVMLLGQRDDVAEIYQAFDSFVLPSLYEGLGMVLIEAQAAGLKCITSNVVPQEAAVSEYLTYLPLDKAECWEKEILKNKNYNRKNFIKEISMKGYNIKDNSLLLKEKYLSFLENQEL